MSARGAEGLAIIAAMVYPSTKASTIETRSVDAVNIARSILLETLKQEPALEEDLRKLDDARRAKEP